MWHNTLENIEQVHGVDYRLLNTTKFKENTVILIFYKVLEEVSEGNRDPEFLRIKKRIIDLIDNSTEQGGGRSNTAFNIMKEFVFLIPFRKFSYSEPECYRYDLIREEQITDYKPYNYGFLFKRVRNINYVLNLNKIIQNEGSYGIIYKYCYYLNYRFQKFEPGDFLDITLTRIYNESVDSLLGGNNFGYLTKNYYQIVLAGISNVNDSNTSKCIFTPFSDNSFGILKKLLSEGLKNLSEDYMKKYHSDNYTFTVRELYIHVYHKSSKYSTRLRGIKNGRGIEYYHKTYYIPTINSFNNCVLQSIVTSIRWKKNKNYLINSQLRHEKARKLKYELSNKFSNFKPKRFCDYDDLEFFANALKLKIILVDNLFNTIRVFKAKKVKNVIKLIKVNQSHVVPAIKRMDIEKIFPNLAKLNYSEPTSIINRECFIERKIKSLKSNSVERNLKFAAFDTETYQDDHGIHHPYAVGFAFFPYRDSDFIEYKSFWGEKCLDDFFKFINNDKFKDYTIYAHNFGKFDSFIIMKYYLLKNTSIWKIINNGFVEQDGGVIALRIVNGFFSIYFKDSIKYIRASLESLTNEFNVKHKKLAGLVDHTKIKKDNFHEFMNVLEPYLENDCKGLLEVVDEFSKSIYSISEINITDCATAASISFRTFLKKYYDEENYTLYTLKPNVEEFIRKSYFGGMNECYYINEINSKRDETGKIINGIFYFDVTSEYPFMGTKPLPFGQPTYYNNMACFVNNEGILSNQFFGWVKCNVIWTGKTDGKIKPLHGYKCNDRLCFPYFLSPTELILFSEEIKLSYSLNLPYKYEFIEGYSFYGAKHMEPFFRDGFENKKNAKLNNQPSLENAFKILINSGYGRWAMVKSRMGVEVYDKDNADLFETFDNGKMYSIGNFNNYIICKVEKEMKIATYIPISAAITSYGRMYLYSIIYDIFSQGGDVYYCDTDSVICNLDITKNEFLQKKYQWDKKGNELGTVKDEIIGGITKAMKKEKMSTDEISNLISKELAIQGTNSWSIDKLIIVGNKNYYYEVKCYSKNNISFNISKLKGFKKSDKEKLNKDSYMTMLKGQEISNEQDFWQSGCRSMTSTDVDWSIKISKITKKFKRNYLKGKVVVDTGKIIPFSIFNNKIL
jgi:hypothetical protein